MTATHADLLFLGTHGHVVAVDRRSGRTRWRTSLPRTGWNVVTLMLEEGRLFCSSGGRAFALDPSDGSILWENGLPGMGHGIVAMCTVDRSTHDVAAIAGQAAADASSTAATNAAT